MNIIREQAIIRALVNQVSDLVEDTDAFSLSGLKSRGWIAVPTFDEGRLFRDTFENIVIIAQELGCNKIHVIPTDSEVKFGADMQVSLNDFDEFYDEHGFYDFILMPDCREFAILSTTSDYNLVAGPVETIERIFKNKIEDIEADFRISVDSMNLAAGSDFVRREQERYMAVLNRYKRLREPD